MKQPSYGRGIETSIQIKETEGFCFQLTPIVINPARANLPNFIKIYTGCGKLSGFSPERKATRGTSVPVSFLASRMMWIFDIFFNNFTADIACGTDKIAARP